MADEILKVDPNFRPVSGAILETSGEVANLRLTEVTKRLKVDIPVPNWIENQSITFDDSTPAKTVEGKGTIDLANLGAIAVVIQVSITFGASANGNAKIRIRSSSDSGTTKDTILLYEQEVSYTASTTKIVTISLRDIPYIEVGVYNGNVADEDITIAAKYAYSKFS